MEEGSQSHDWVLLALSTITSPEKEAMVERLLDRGVKVFLDSGIYSLTAAYARTGAVTPEQAFATAPELVPGFQELWDRYVRLCTRWGDRVWGYVELDLGGVDSKRRLRNRLHDLGLDPIPVYHPLFDGWDYFEELATGYDRICWANMADAEPARRKRMVATAWERHRQFPDLWIHLLGFTPNDWLAGWPADSCDSSTWLGGVRWGGESGTSYLRRLSALPLDYRYSTSEQTPKAVHLAAVNSHMQHRNWRRILADRELELGGAS